MIVKHQFAYFLFSAIFFGLFMAASDYAKKRDMDIQEYILYGILFGLGMVIFNLTLKKFSKETE